MTILDERDDNVERQVQRVPTIEPVVAETLPQSEDGTNQTQHAASALNPTTKDTSIKNSTARVATTTDETPHVYVETNEAREARLDRQWKEIKVDLADLPDVYAKLAKIKLTGTVHEASHSQS